MESNGGKNVKEGLNQRCDLVIDKREMRERVEMFEDRHMQNAGGCRLIQDCNEGNENVGLNYDLVPLSQQPREGF